jgi:flagellar protein FlbT
MYINEDVAGLRKDYFQLINDIVRAAPSTVPIVDEINNEILTGSLYKALKAAKKLIQYEQDLLSNAK